MAARYVPRSPFAVVDGRGIPRVFNPDRKGADGTLGYTKDELGDLLKRKGFKDSFVIQEVSGDTVEEATAAPGAKRSVSPKSA